MTESAVRLLGRLENLRTVHGVESATEKLELLEQLEDRQVGTSDQVFRLHEAVCFLRAYPDSPKILRQVNRILAGFAGRSDLIRHRRQLRDTGIAGTDIFYRFFWITARWLARNWPDRLSIDWTDFEHQGRLVELLDLLMPYCEKTIFGTMELSAREWIQDLKAEDETDGAFLVRRFEQFGVTAAIRERIYEQVDVPMVLTPGPGTPSRTLDRVPRRPVSFQEGALFQKRPDLVRELEAEPKSIETLSRRQGQNMINLVRSVMVTRSRDLDAFAQAYPEDARRVSFDRGLEFVAIGTRPERRLLLETTYGCLTIKNGVPIGYALATSLFGSTEIAFHIFDTFRGVETGLVFARALAMAQSLFPADVFAIDPYQLGHDNDEGLASGAWWFYYKLGFRPDDPGVRRLLRKELARIKANPRHRSSRSTLNELSAEYMFLDLGKKRPDVLGRAGLAQVGLAISEYLASRFGCEREAGIEICAAESAEMLGLGPLKRLSRNERMAWDRWAPLVLILPGVKRWSSAQKKALAEVVRLKGGQSESEFVAHFERHKRLRRAVFELCG